MKEMIVYKTHGSCNDNLVAFSSVDAVSRSSVDIAEFVQYLCNRDGPVGADGIYFVSEVNNLATANYFNSDGSEGGMCGNGLRAVTRLLVDQMGVDEVRIMTAGSAFLGKRSQTIEGIVTTSVSSKPLSFAALELPIRSDSQEFIEMAIPESGVEWKFTAVSLPNAHIVAMCDQYDEDKWIAVGEKMSQSNECLPNGANVSVAVEIGDDEYFVRTYEMGAGPTASCGSGAAAVRAAMSKLGIVEGNGQVLVRNIGGPALLGIEESEGQLRGTLDGNATLCYSFHINLETNDVSDRVDFVDDRVAFRSVFEENIKKIESAGIETDFTNAYRGLGDE